jgi:hypothetical protein
MKAEATVLERNNWHIIILTTFGIQNFSVFLFLGNKTPRIFPKNARGGKFNEHDESENFYG